MLVLELHSLSRRACESPLYIGKNAIEATARDPDPISKVPTLEVAETNADLMLTGPAMLWKGKQARLFRFVYLWPYLTVITIALIAKLPTLTNSIIFIDEPLYLAQAMHLDNFGAFIYSAQYRVEPKFQLGLLPYIAAFALSPKYTMLILHLMGLGAVIISCCLLVLLSFRYLNSYVPGLYATIMLLLYLNRSNMTAATLLEYFQLPLLLLAVHWFLSSVLTTSEILLRAYRLVASGICCGLATLVKPPGICVLAAFGLIVLILFGRGSWRELLPLGLGAAVSILLFVVPYLFNPAALEGLRFSYFTVLPLYPSYGGEEPLSTRFQELIYLSGELNFVTFVVAVLSFCVIMLRTNVKLQVNQVGQIAQLTMLLTGITLFVGYGTGRSKEHYLIAVLPFILLFIGFQLRILHRRIRNRYIRLAAISFFGLILLVSEARPRVQSWQSLSYAGVSYSREVSQLDFQNLLAYIEQQTSPHDRIWVYYNSPEIYWLANRKPATTDPTGSWLSFEHNALWQNKTYNELRLEKPKLIIGINLPRFGISEAPHLLALPKVSELLAEAYQCDKDRVAGAIVCKRK